MPQRHRIGITAAAGGRHGGFHRCRSSGTRRGNGKGAGLGVGGKGSAGAVVPGQHDSPRPRRQGVGPEANLSHGDGTITGLGTTGPYPRTKVTEGSGVGVAGHNGDPIGIELILVLKGHVEGVTHFDAGLVHADGLRIGK